MIIIELIAFKRSLNVIYVECGYHYMTLLQYEIFHKIFFVSIHFDAHMSKSLVMINDQSD